MTEVAQTAGGIIARAVLKRAREQAFGVLVCDVPEFHKESFLAALSPSVAGRASLRLAMPGLPEEQARVMRTAATRLGFASDRFVTTVEGAERWRNDPKIHDTIVVVTPGELPKLNSLNRFQTVSGSDLYRLLCEEAEQNLSPNDAQRQLWKSLRSKALMSLVPLDGLLAYWNDLSDCSESEIPVRSREYLPKLGLLPDPELFQSPTSAKITQKLLENFRIVDQLRILSRTDRQKIARSLARQGADTVRLKTIYSQVMRFYRDQKPSLLSDLSLNDAKALLRATSDVPPPAPGSPEPAPDRPPEGSAESRPEVRALDLLIGGDQEGLEQLGSAVIAAIEAEDNGDDADTVDPKNGTRLDVSLTHPFQKLIERCVNAKEWGGFIVTMARSLDEAIARVDKADCRAFDVDGPNSSLREMLQEVVRLGADPGLVPAFDDIRTARAALSTHVKALLLEPLVYLNSSNERFALAERYIDSYRTLIEGLKRGYEIIAVGAPEGVELLCSRILALDTIVLRTGAGFKAVLSPLHPLHLWKFVELSRQIRAQAIEISDRERALLRSKADDLPNFVTTLYLSNYITDAGPKLLPEAGVRQGLPYFEELAHQYAGRDGVFEVVRLIEKFCVLYPHARLGLRVALVDAPEIEFLLRELVRLADRQGDDLRGLHVSAYYTVDMHSPAAGLGGGAEDEEGAERYRGVGAGSRFTLEVADQRVNASSLADRLAEHPAHIIFYFDPSAARAQRFPRAPSLRVHPLCLPMQFSFDRLTKSVRVVPAADGGIFSEHNDLRNRLSNIVGSSFYGVTAELQAEAQSLKRLAGESTWLVVADRAQEGALAFDVPRVALQRCNKRDVAVYTNDRGRFVRELDRQLRRCNYTPSVEALGRLISDPNILLNDGLLSLVATSAGSPTVDERRTRGLLGTLVGAAWYRRTRPASLIVSIDSPEARRWLELRDTNDRADLFGVEYEADGGFVVDLIEVKTYEHPEDAYRLASGEISGDAVDQLLNTAAVIREVFTPEDAPKRIVSPQRREILRQHLFRECFFEGRSDEDRQVWSQRLNDLFTLESRVRIRMSLVVVGLTQVHEARIRDFIAQSQAIQLVEMAEDEVRAYVGERVLPRPRSGTGGLPPTDESDDNPNGGTEGAVGLNHPAADEGESEASPPTPQVVTGSEGPDMDSPDKEEREQIDHQASTLRRILRDHGVLVQELDAEKAQVGPSVIRYRVRLRPGAKLTSLRSRAEDIGRELATRSIPFIDNVAGENYVGIDLERPRRQIVPLLPAIDALPSAGYAGLPIAVGVAPDGSQVHLDLVQLPHILVAGSTLSGKTVFLHAVLLSLIAKLPPERLELIVIDPKATDFVLYNGLPHLRAGTVITEAEDAIQQLRSLTNAEMRERTAVLQQARLPNISEYNAKHQASPMRPIVVVIDEYADLMAVLQKRDRSDFEREINRLAQRARSVGIHLVLATQRPTADIVTGLLKANMPTRVSFRLPQRVDSQTILDQSGAENLFGRGDMLLMLNDRLVRLQGYYMSPTDMAAFLGARFPGSGFAPEPDDLLEVERDDADRANHESLIGEATCLAASTDSANLADGDVMVLEVEARKGEGPEVIGLAGDVLKQSALAAWRYVQQHAADYDIAQGRVSGTGISVHLVNIARYREGPSAGVAMVVAIVSALSGRAVRPRIAMSGEVSLKGHVGRVGGIAQKVVAAWRRGRTTVILPRESEADVALVPVEILRQLTVHYVFDVKEAVALALEAE